MTTDNQESLSQLLEQDREQVCASLQADRKSSRVRQVLEKETDRLMYRAARMTDDGSRSRAVQGMLQVVKNTLPLLESVTDTEVWEKNAPQASGRKSRVSIPGIVSLAAGLFAVAAGLFSQASAGKVLNPGAVLWAVGGCALLVLYLGLHPRIQNYIVLLTKDILYTDFLLLYVMLVAAASHDPEKLRLLEAYYTSGGWQEDYEADERGDLPPDLKRGVLSQDALYDLLEEARE